MSWWVVVSGIGIAGVAAGLVVIAALLLAARSLSQSRIDVAVFVVSLLWLPGLVAAQDSPVLSTLQRLRAEYPTPMSQAQQAELLNRAAWAHRQGGWGLLRKDAGNRCPTPAAVFVACDILVHAPSLRHFDVLADTEGEGRPVWRDAGPIDGARFIAPWAPPDAPSGPPAPPPGPPSTWTAEMEAIRQYIGTLAETARDHHDRINALIQHANQVDGRFAAVDAEIAALKARPIYARCTGGINLGFARLPLMNCELKP